MNAIPAKFLARLPSNGLVASSVTLVVSAWFAVASGAILADPVSPYTQRPVPQFRETITVTAKASDALPQYRETITVVAKAAPVRQTVRVAAQPADLRIEQPASL
jgi:hypothetical protein